MEKQQKVFFDFLRFCILITGLLVILAIMYIMQVVFGMSASRLIVPPNEKYGKFVLNEVLKTGNFGKHDERSMFTILSACFKFHIMGATTIMIFSCRTKLLYANSLSAVKMIEIRCRVRQGMCAMTLAVL